MRALLIIVPLIAGCTLTHYDASSCESGLYELHVRIESDERIRDLFDARGASGIAPDGRPVLILPPLSTLESLTTWGHELAHVVCGNYHEGR